MNYMKLFLLVVSCNGLRRITPPEEVKEFPDIDKAHIYVLNLKNRVDKCNCMRNQLKDSPYPTFRFDASTITSYKERCGDLSKKEDGHEMNDKRKAAFCTHNLAWTHANQQSEKPEYVILMEDDAEIAPGFWKELSKLLNSGCAANQLITVDSFNPYPWRKHTERILGDHCPKDVQKELRLVDETDYHFGSQILIAPSAILHKVISPYFHITDHYPWYQKRGVTVNYWLPGMVTQATMVKEVNSESSVSHQATGCDASVSKSDIGKSFAQMNTVFECSEA